MEILLTPDQIRIASDRALVQAVCAGRRWGKSTLAAAWLTERAVNKPRSNNAYCSLSYARSIRMADMMWTALRRHGWARRAQFPPRLIAPSGSVVQFRSVDRPQNLLGEGLDALVLDEVEHVPRAVWEEILAPMLADTRGRALLVGTPMPATWWESLHRRGMAGDPHIRSWLFPTRTGLRFQDVAGREQLAALRATLDDATWRREFECEWVAGSDAVFGAWVDRIVEHAAPPQGPQAGWTYCAGLDIGRVRDNTVLVVAGWPAGGGAGRVVYVREWPLGMEHRIMAAQAADEVRRWGATCVLDATGGTPRGQRESYCQVYEAAIPGTRPVVWGTLNKAEMISALKLGIEQSAFTIPACYATLIRQLRLYRYVVHALTNSIGYAAPPGEHDDHVAALAMAYLCHRRNWAAPRTGLPLSVLGR